MSTTSSSVQAGQDGAWISVYGVQRTIPSFGEHATWALSSIPDTPLRKGIYVMLFNEEDGMDEPGVAVRLTSVWRREQAWTVYCGYGPCIGHIYVQVPNAWVHTHWLLRPFVFAVRQLLANTIPAVPGNRRTRAMLAHIHRHRAARQDAGVPGLTPDSGTILPLTHRSVHTLDIPCVPVNTISSREPSEASDTSRIVEPGSR
ncbi:hypothetical protein CERSUDRAFT_95535 [Gelatoporia subvermispora B]|uniref:Uncharacterized protein n=1 Tax=Ceriporiopsis subvermispora (strain B) TaxID=914234 RepID=M2RBL6_CERS8|nr:hypothetical protein CERSUDRAFT_95535 [Gelatoporia subvermispora B]